MSERQIERTSLVLGLVHTTDLVAVVLDVERDEFVRVPGVPPGADWRLLALTPDGAGLLLDMILRFIEEPSVPFSNSAAEREVSPVKVKQGSGGCWRTMQGLADFAIIWSYLSTAAKHSIDALDALTQLFETGPWLPPEPLPP